VEREFGFPHRSQRIPIRCGWFGGFAHGYDPLSLVSRASQLRACVSNAPAADSMAANIHRGNVVAVAICRHAAATAQDAEAISRAAAGSPVGDRRSIPRRGRSAGRPLPRHGRTSLTLSHRLICVVRIGARGTGDWPGGRRTFPVRALTARGFAGVHGGVHAVLLDGSPWPVLPVGRVPVAMVVVVKPVAR
jgi:hypothetical protein